MPVGRTRRGRIAWSVVGRTLAFGLDLLRRLAKAVTRNGGSSFIGSSFVMVHQTLRLNATLMLTTAVVNRVRTKRKRKTSQAGALLAVARMVSSVVIPISIPSETRASTKR